MVYVKLALPKGALLESTSCFLNEIGLGFKNYTKETRLYHLEAKTNVNLSAKIFQERDIPIQVAIGNYDIGICGLDWVEELLAKYPNSQIIKMADLGYNEGYLYLATSKYSEISSNNISTLETVNWRIISEYPNLCERFASNLRIKKFRIFPVWGAVEAYPPEDADLVIIKVLNKTQLSQKQLIPVKLLFRTNATLIINSNSLKLKNMGNIISRFNSGLKMKYKPWENNEINQERLIKIKEETLPINKINIRLALPDGHQLTPTLAIIKKSGIKLDGYDNHYLKRRPKSNIPWLEIKVIRPQDMPTQVAIGNFDIAITGKDWFLDHLYRFPSSPIIKLVDLDYGKVKIVAVVNQDFPANNAAELKILISSGKYIPLKVASEYLNIAERYVHDIHLKRYKMIPTTGASEALVPDDADLLVENTQTGKTLSEHKLKIIDNIMNSSACIIANKNSVKSVDKRDRIKLIIGKLTRTK